MPPRRCLQLRPLGTDAELYQEKFQTLCYFSFLRKAGEQSALFTLQVGVSPRALMSCENYG